jgi:hypothetical protein
MWRAWISLALVVTACAEFPEVDAALSRGDPQAGYPDLLPLEALLSADDPRISETDDRALLGRAAALRARANALRRPVIDRQTRSRMEDGVTLP